MTKFVSHFEGDVDAMLVIATFYFCTLRSHRIFQQCLFDRVPCVSFWPLTRKPRRAFQLALIQTIGRSVVSRSVLSVLSSRVSSYSMVVLLRAF